MIDAGKRKDVRYNMVIGILDGGFFGAALGFASFVTVIPLFVSTLTSSALLIGMVWAVHSVGWQLPQLLTVRHVSRLRRYKRMVVLMTIHERLPFFGLALVAYFAASMSAQAALILTFLLLIWQGLGGGFTATAWQSMIAKIIPPRRRGIFYGTQSAAANLFASGTAVAAGFILQQMGSPLDYTLCFLLAGIVMMIGLAFLAATREADSPAAVEVDSQVRLLPQITGILRRDADFRGFLIARVLSQFATMASAFYVVYAVRHYGMSEELAGFMTAVLMIAQTSANPVMGWMGDRWGHRIVMQIGILAALLSALLAWLAPGLSWFYLVFALTGIANVGLWTTALAMTLEFGSETERPAYIGLANTLVAPGTLIAPLLGGWLADTAGYTSTFIATAVAAGITLGILHFLVRDPQKSPDDTPQPSNLAPSDPG